MTTSTSTQRGWIKPVLTIVWIVTSGVFTTLLLHPAVPETVRSFVARPNRLLARALEYSAHTAVFFIGTQFALVCMEATTRRRRIAIIAAGAIAAVAAEAAQAWVPTRGVDVFDAVCNLAGVGLAAFVYVKMFALLSARSSAAI